MTTKTVLKDGDIDLKALLGKTIMYLSARNRRNIARVMFPAPDHSFLVIRPMGSKHTQVIHQSDVISIIP